MKAIFVSFLFIAFLIFSSCTSYASEAADPAPANVNVDVSVWPAPQEDHPQKPKKESDEDDETFRGGFIGGVGFPRPLAIEGLLKFDRILAVGLEVSAMPQLTIGTVQTNFWGMAGDVRLFPFRGAFFLGMRAGRQYMSGTSSVSDGNLGTINQTASADTWFVNPRLGFLYTWKSGFTLGIDAGIQLPVKTTRTTSLADNTSSDTINTIASVENTLGARTTPTFDLLRIGFLF